MTGVTPLGRIAAASLADAPGGDTGFRLLPSGEMAFDARLALAEAATRSIDAQYYHIHADTAGAAFLAALRDAAVRGVRVRLLVDDYHAGELYLLLRGLAAFPNVEVRLFNPLPARYGTPIRRMLMSLHEFTRINRRMHNKLFVADNQFAVYGGRNIADEYFTRHGEANFIDLDVLSAGAVVRELSASFDRYWNSEQVWALEQRLHALERAVEPAERRADFDVRLNESPAHRRTCRRGTTWARARCACRSRRAGCNCWPAVPACTTTRPTRWSDPWTRTRPARRCAPSST